MNIIPHVYEIHEKCIKEYCLKSRQKNAQSNNYSNATSEQRTRIMKIIVNLASKSDSLLENGTSNLAEQYMHQIAKF